MKSEPTRMGEMLVGLPDMNVFNLVDEADKMHQFHIETKCGRCGVVARVKERPVVVLVDVPLFDRCTRLVNEVSYEFG